MSIEPAHESRPESDEPTLAELLGDKEHDDVKTRQIQQNGTSPNCLEVNLTKFAKEYHGLEKGQLVEIQVREGGVAIVPFQVEGNE